VKKENIGVLISGGTHRAPLDSEYPKILGSEIWPKHREKIAVHSCTENLVTIGDLDGMPVEIDRVAFESEILIPLSDLDYHYFAGVAGGPKQICPGICGEKVITDEHLRMFGELGFADNVDTGVVDGNPVFSRKIEIVRLILQRLSEKGTLVYSILSVVQPEGRLVQISGGDIFETHKQDRLILDKVIGWVRAVDGVDFTIHKGETFGLVGESGCGKTTTSKLILLLEKPTAGTVLFEGKDIFSLNGDGLQEYRRSVQAIFQDPTSSLNPRMRVADIVSEPIVAQARQPKNEVRQRLEEAIQDVGLSLRNLSLYPHEFSGGQRQRIAIARALAPRPKCIILDEPVSALDVSIRAQILNLLRELQDRFGFSYLMISHDLAAVKYMSTRIGVMYVGKLVEIAGSKELYSKPLHPYTQALLSAALPHHPDAQRKEIVLPGEVPSPLDPPPGCRFHRRCDYAKPLCSQAEPGLTEATPDHRVACYLHG